MKVAVFEFTTSEVEVPLSIVNSTVPVGAAVPDVCAIVAVNVTCWFRGCVLPAGVIAIVVVFGSAVTTEENLVTN